VLQIESRFAIGIFIRGDVPWDEDSPVDEEKVVVCSFMPQASEVMSTYKPCTKGYRLYCGDGILQLFNKQRTDTWVFVNTPPSRSGAEIAASIALQKISGRVQKVNHKYNPLAIQL
jgi:regulator of nonsense transcripts 1